MIRERADGARGRCTGSASSACTSRSTTSAPVLVAEQAERVPDRDAEDPEAVRDALVGEEGDELFVERSCGWRSRSPSSPSRKGSSRCRSSNGCAARLRARAGLPVQPPARGSGGLDLLADPDRYCGLSRARTPPCPRSGNSSTSRAMRIVLAPRDPSAPRLGAARRSRGVPAPRASPPASSACRSRSAGCARA